MLRLELLGDLRVLADGAPVAAPRSQKARLVLAFLAVNPGQHARETVAEQFWGGTLASARASLGTALTAIRRSLGDASTYLATTRSSLGLPPHDDLTIDIREFEELLRQGRAEEALALWRGDFLQDTSGEWVEATRSRYRMKAARAYEHLATAAASAGDQVSAVELTRRQQELRPDDLFVWEQLIARLDLAGAFVEAKSEHDALLRHFAAHGTRPPRRLIEMQLARGDESRGATLPQPRPDTGQRDQASQPQRPVPRRTVAASGERGVSDAVSAALDRFEGSTLDNVYTGFDELDALTHGLPRPGLSIIAGRPNMGATSLALGILTNASVYAGVPSALFSPSMAESEVTQRLVASEAGIRAQALRQGRVDPSRWPNILRASSQLAAAPLVLDDSSRLSVQDLTGKLSSLVDPPHLVVLDDVHALSVTGAHAGDPTALAQLLFELRRAARELDVALLATMEVSGRCEQRLDKRPILQDLPGFFEVASRPDLVVLLYRPEYYDPDAEGAGTLEAYVAEHRFGSTGRAELTLQPEYPRVLNMASTKPADRATRA